MHGSVIIFHFDYTYSEKKKGKQGIKKKIFWERIERKEIRDIYLAKYFKPGEGKIF